MSAGRLFEIVYLLLDKRRMTFQELAARFEVFVRTIYRDVDALSSAGIPVYAIPGKGGGVALMEHYCTGPGCLFRGGGAPTFDRAAKPLR